MRSSAKKPKPSRRNWSMSAAAKSRPRRLPRRRSTARPMDDPAQGCHAIQPQAVCDDFADRGVLRGVPVAAVAGSRASPPGRRCAWRPSRGVDARCPPAARLAVDTAVRAVRAGPDIGDDPPDPDLRFELQLALRVRKLTGPAQT